ncbi:MAG: hypothetical protein A3F46_04095 [Legionellales bacterium RIFCSPHIGHO2_12_FULL_42_9]|nr:MAG: hypothetical protein A3F46_04095 [Legionellales bacterium RIFCSPHIGHO2_12_FULL_42_9]
MSDCCLIPILSSQAGVCLTLDNWQQAGVRRGVYHLEALITKPGMRVLQEFSDLRSYTAWPGTIILNACLTTVSATGEYLVRSPYDGSVITISKKALLELIDHLRADYVVWPTTTSDESIFRHSTSQFIVPGINHFEDGQSLFYLIGEASLDEAKALLTPDSTTSIWVESDKPASDALQGNIYSSDGVFNLLEPHYRDDFSPLDDVCCCFTCQEGYTRAYLHHLLQQTPLLAQRFLILHNYTFRSLVACNRGYSNSGCK